MHLGAGVGPAVGVSVLRGQGVGLPTVKVPFWPGVRTDFGQGLQYMKDRLQEELLLTSLPPVPTSPSQLSLASNQYLIQIPT